MKTCQGRLNSCPLWLQLPLLQFETILFLPSYFLDFERKSRKNCLLCINVHIQIFIIFVTPAHIKKWSSPCEWIMVDVNYKIRYCVNSYFMWSLLCIHLAKCIHVSKTFSMCSEGQGRKVGIAWVAYRSIKMRNNQQTLNYFQRWRRCFVLILCVAVTDFSFNLIRTMAWYISNASFTSAQMCWFHWSDPWFTLL